MAVRPIDGTWSKFVWNLGESSESLARKFREGKACLVDLRLAVEAQPTLTPPNEWMEALEAINNSAVAYIEGGPYENDLPGMELAVEIDRLSRDFVRQPNEPLSINQLKDMKGKPVWLEFTEYDEDNEQVNYRGWALVSSEDVYKFSMFLILPEGDLDKFFEYEDYGKTWACYRRPPEGEV